MRSLCRGQSLIICLILLGLSVGKTFAADSVTDNLSKLEVKFFQHDYPKDDKDERIARLEKLVFGEAKPGSDDERLKNLLALVPNLNPKMEEDPLASSPSNPPANSDLANNTNKPQPTNNQSYQADKSEIREQEPVANDSSYPAVTAIEKKLLGRDYIGESVGKRLERLELKAFGKTAASDDLQDRLDKLKSATGIDVAKAMPPGSEWADEDDDGLPGSHSVAEQPDLRPFSGIGGGSGSYGRDSRRDMQNSLSRQPRAATGYQDEYAGSGTFGAGSAPRAAQYSGMPPTAPDIGRNTLPSPAPNALGMNQQLALLEKEVFHKTYNNETIPSRLNRLESTVFPQDRVAQDKSLPERVSRLVAAVPTSPAGSSIATKPKRDPDFPEFDDLDTMGSIPVAPPRGQGGLSKIMNGLGNMLGGGYSSSYSSAPGTLVTDPASGMLYDQYTGTLIDPMTGAVVGRRSVATPGYGNPYGGFNSGFAPMNPYGGMGGNGMGFGMGGSGIRFGTGMWP